MGRGKACNNGLYILLNCVHPHLGPNEKSGLCYCPLVVVVCCCSGREVRLWRGGWPALAASSSNANRSIVGSSVFYSPSLLFIRVLCKHPRIPLTGQNNDRRKHSCEDQGGVFILGEAYIQNNHDQHRVTFE